MVPLHVVTGGLGYTGRSIVEQLLARDVRIRTLTNSPNRPHDFGPRLEIHPLNFENPAALEASLRGAAVLYNTYWVRFNHRMFNFDQAVRNTKILFDAARRAGVTRIVHVSVLHADQADDLAYYCGKHQLEKALRDLGIPHSIVRPGVLFGRFDILVNNICWMLRHLPFFGVFGNGDYHLRPLHVDDMAALMIRHADATNAVDHGTTVDAVGPERFTFRELVQTLATILGQRRLVIGVPPRVAWAVASTLNPLLRDVVITWEEVLGLTRNLLDSAQPAAGTTVLTDWARSNSATLGIRYASEVGRRLQRAAAYTDVT